MVQVIFLCKCNLTNLSFDVITAGCMQSWMISEGILMNGTDGICRVNETDIFRRSAKSSSGNE